jgi:hypothetical protein
VLAAPRPASSPFPRLRTRLIRIVKRSA